MKKIYKFIISGILLANISYQVPVFAIDNLPEPQNITTNSHSLKTEMRLDNIIIKYRIYNGIKQYRRWNATKGIWVDAYWINL